MIHTVLILSILITVLCIILITFSAFVFLKGIIKSKNTFLVTTSITISILFLLASYVGYRFLAPQFGIAMEQEKVLSSTKKLISDFENTQNAVKVSIGKFRFDPSGNEAFNGEIFNERGGVPITLKNTANYRVIADIEVIAYDTTGKKIEAQSLGTAGDLKAGETKTFWLFRSIIKQSDIEKYKSASYKENVSERMTTKMPDE